MEGVGEKDGRDGEVGGGNKTYLTQAGGKGKKEEKNDGKHYATLSS